MVSDECSLILPWSEEDPKSFFCYRSELVTSAITEIKQFLTDSHELGEVYGVWLLTE